MKSGFPEVSPDFDFDDLSALATRDSVAFEEFRYALINRVILSGANSSLLAALQCRLQKEMDTDEGKPGYLSCLRLSEWLKDSYRKLDQQLGQGQDC
ncbi:DUF3135 domain-containing protein [Dechloromonas agitata]|uniref:DUF3135 domain-containing protein n=1 Tax=Dechloromonas agitata TaxID=73030 RepID=UPI00237DC623|nr:DUF3135 domain-containing protein [Dechloromonas agitata]MDE1544078.1 DUF3135 domain-containing protein [Dechloromonas agitata]